MAVLVWDQTGEREYETGVEKGVLYPIGSNGSYEKGVAWNGLTAVTESPTGAEVTKKYADNINYLSLVSAETFEGTIKAYTYPDEWAACDGSASPADGVTVGQQARKGFGLAYKTLKGNDVAGQDYGYILHLVWGALAAPSEKEYASVNDSPDAIEFSWKFTTTPVAIPGLKPSAIIRIDSTKVDASALAALEALLYGQPAVDPQLPSPADVIALFTAEAPTVVTATAPTFVANTGVITIPTVTGVQYFRKDTMANVNGGSTVTIGAPGQSIVIGAKPKPSYVLSPTSDDDWSFTRTS